MKAGVPLVFATTWGDNGAETNLTAALLGMQLYGEMTYTGVYDRDALHARFRRCCQGDPQAFLDLDGFNILPGTHGIPEDPENACKILLYQDPLVQLFEEDTRGIPMSTHYGRLAARFEGYAEEYPAFRRLFRFYGALGRALELKCAWHEQAVDAVREKDRGLALQLSEPSLPCHRREDSSIVRVNTMDEIATPGKIDYN